MANAYVQVVLATLFNLCTVYFVKKANGFTVLWPTVWALLTIGLTQWMISRAMAGGMDMALSITAVVVCVMIGSTLMGVFLFHESLPALKILGFGLAVAGVVVASLAKA